MCLKFVKKSFKVSKLEGWRDVNSFSTWYTLKSSYFPYRVSNLCQISFGVFNPERWKRRSHEIERHKNPNASSFLFKNIGLYRVTMDTEEEPAFVIEKAISPYLLSMSGN